MYLPEGLEDTPFNQLSAAKKGFNNGAFINCQANDFWNKLEQRHFSIYNFLSLVYLFAFFI